MVGVMVGGAARALAEINPEIQPQISSEISPEIRSEIPPQIRPQIRLVSATGRALIQHPDAIEEAKRLALEDALYYAALTGGAKIDGFSTVDETTRLDERYIIRPSAHIVDYAITHEMHDEQHYEITIEAAIGEAAIGEGGAHNCQNRPMSALTQFKPVMHIERTVPSWMSQMPAYLFQSLHAYLAQQPRLNVRDARGHHFNASMPIGNPHNAFDYRGLTTGRIYRRAGDFALETQIHFAMRSAVQKLAKTEYLIITLDSLLHEGHKQHKISNEFKIKLGRIWPWPSLTILSQIERDEIRAMIKLGAETHAEKLTGYMLCAPLTAHVNMVQGRLEVKLGQRQGLGRHHLAFVEGADMRWSILRIYQAYENTTILKPLDDRRDLADFIGAEVRFLEFH